MNDNDQKTGNVIDFLKAKQRLRGSSDTPAAASTLGTSKKQQAEQMLAEELARQAEVRKARSIATGLCLAASIGEGAELSAVIGDGTERSNVMAVFTWVCHHRDLIQEAEQSNVRPVLFLLPHLKKDLDEASDYL